jgi:hypothetical protein
MEYFTPHHERILERCAIVNTGLGASDIRNTLELMVDLQTTNRKALSLRTRKWLQDFQGYPAVAKRLGTIYGDLL